MRRRVLSHCLTKEFSDSFPTVLELITNQLERDFDFIWYLEALLSRSDRLASDELAMLEEAAPSPMILRIVKRRIDRALSE
ncbi:MAG: hypothetical protein JSU96_02305 [Acidobacteriota bacterium]|nr:MAG: hypothetical protein JSU96_02305 [Acidobacteriota bacterium]